MHWDFPKAPLMEDTSLSFRKKRKKRYLSRPIVSSCILIVLAPRQKQHSHRKKRKPSKSLKLSCDRPREVAKTQAKTYVGEEKLFHSFWPFSVTQIPFDESLHGSFLPTPLPIR